MSTPIKPADLPVQWQGISEHTTQRGRVKPVLTGIPGERFWYSYKHHADFREQLKAATITVQKIARANWQVVVWINARNSVLVEDIGFKIPASAPKTEQPF